MILVYAHSGLRYLVLLAGILVIGYALYGAFTRRDYDKTMRILGGVFAGSTHLNVLLGLALLFTGRFYPQLMGHIFMMIFAAVAAQIVPSVMKRRPMEERSYLPHAIGAVVALGLIVGGLMAIGRPVFGSAYS